jgi:hypothetical protein
MKRILASAVALGCFAAAGVAFAGMPAATGVNGSLHDMNTFVAGPADTMGRVCVFCHTPHHAETNLGQTNTAPLWNREATAQTYLPYQWVTPANAGTDTDAVAFAILDPLAGPSRLCMSCHDGVVSADQHGQAWAQAGTKAISGRANLGSDLTQTHPIGFDYVAIRNWRNSIAGVSSAGDSEIVDPAKGFASQVTVTADAATNQGVYNAVVRNTGANKRIKDVLFGGNIMTCASCHEVHNKENAIQTAYTGIEGSDSSKAPNYFLYAKQQDSLICLSCHVK